MCKWMGEGKLEEIAKSSRVMCIRSTSDIPTLYGMCAEAITIFGG